MRASKIVMLLLFLGGLGLLGLMGWQVGLHDLCESLQVMGFWVAPYLLLRLIPMSMHAAAWAACFPGERLPVSLWRLLLIDRAGSAINQVTPTAMVGGEVVKVLLLDPLIPREQAMAAVVIDKVSATLAKMIYLALGLLYLVQRLPLPPELQLSLALSIALIILGLIGFIAFQRYGALSTLVSWTGYLGVSEARRTWLRKHSLPLDAQLVAYYTHYPWRFIRSLLLHLIGAVFDIVKVYILLRLLLGVNAPGFAEAAMVAVAVAALDQMFFFVPGRLGTLEGARFMVLSLLGIGQIYGLAFGLIGRAEQLVWSGLGLLAYAISTRLAPPQVIQREASTPLP